MPLALRLYTTAAVALAGPALVAVSLAASAAADPADVSQQIASLGQSEITYGTALYNQGDLADGLNYIVNGENNVSVAAPQDALLAQIESPTQPFYYTSYDPTQQLPFPTDSAQLTANLQTLYDTGQSLVSQGANDTALGATNLGLSETVQGDDLLTVGLSEESAIGPLYISFANDPASYGADSLGYLTHEIETEVIGPISTLAEVSGVDLGPVGGLLSAADAVQTVNLFADHWDGYLAGNPVDAAHIAVETPELEFMAAGALTAAELPPVSIGLDAIATGFGGLDTLLNSLIGAG